MTKKMRRNILAGISTLVTLVGWGFSQTVTVPSTLVSFPDLILWNGKIILVDNENLDSNMGRIVSAMAVREGKILAVGENDEIQSLVGQEKKVIDLKGRTVIPGLVDAHDHPHDWLFANEAVVKSVIQDKDIVYRFVHGGGAEKIKTRAAIDGKAYAPARLSVGK